MKKRLIGIISGLVLLLVCSYAVIISSSAYLGARLFTAIQEYEDGNIYEQLLNRGADPNYRHPIDHKPGVKEWATAAMIGTPPSREEKMPLLIIACFNSNTEAARALLKHGANPNVDFANVSPLAAAIEASCPDIVQLLLEYGADRNHPVYGGQTPLQVARRTKNPRIVAFLEKAGVQK